MRENGTTGDTYVLVSASHGGERAGLVLIVATIVSLLIVGLAVLVVLPLMRHLGDVPAATYDALKQEDRQEAKAPEEAEKL